MPNQPPLLLTYLFGESAPAALQGASPRLLLWASAFDAWLAERLRRFKPVTVKHDRHTWQRLLSRTRKMPWELTQADLEAHLAWLGAQGFSTVTVYKTVGQVSSFYRWCSLHAPDPACPPAFNPAASLTPPRPVVYSGLQLLSLGEVRRLLQTLWSDESPVGKRDYAFILARLRLGVPLRCLQKLQWAQIEDLEAGAHVRWREGGDPARLPDEVWQALQRYLSAAGRLEAMSPSAYIFAPLRQPTREEIGDRASDWRADRPFSQPELLYSLKRYGRVAAIPSEKLTLAVLRLTAVRLQWDASASLASMRTFMDSRLELKTIKYHLTRLPELPPDVGDVGHAVSLPPAHPASPSDVGHAVSLPPAHPASPSDVGHAVSLPPAHPASPSDVGHAVSLPPAHPASPPDVGHAVSLPPAHPASPPDVGHAVSLPPVISHKQFLFQPGDGLKHGMYAKSQPPQLVQELLAENIQGIDEALAGLRLLGRGLLERHVQAASASAMARLGDAYTLTAARLAGMLKTEKEMGQEKSGSQEKAAMLENVLDWLVRTEVDQGRPATRQAVLADLEAQALGAGAEQGLAARRLEEEIASTRLILRSTLSLALQAGDTDEYIHLVEVYSSGCSRLVRMLQRGHAGQDQLINYIREQILLAIDEVSKEWNLSA